MKIVKGKNKTAHGFAGCVVIQIEQGMCSSGSNFKMTLSDNRLATIMYEENGLISQSLNTCTHMHTFNPPNHFSIHTYIQEMSRRA